MRRRRYRTKRGEPRAVEGAASSRRLFDQPVDRLFHEGHVGVAERQLQGDAVVAGIDEAQLEIAIDAVDPELEVASGRRAELSGEDDDPGRQAGHAARD